MEVWTREELAQLEPILERMEQDLAPLEGRRILVLCCGAGEVAFRLARRALRRVGLHYICQAQASDFREWMEAAGLENVEVVDLTQLVKGCGSSGETVILQHPTVWVTSCSSEIANSSLPGHLLYLREGD